MAEAAFESKCIEAGASGSPRERRLQNRCRRALQEPTLRNAQGGAPKKTEILRVYDANWVNAGLPVTKGE